VTDDFWRAQFSPQPAWHFWFPSPPAAVAVRRHGCGGFGGGHMGGFGGAPIGGLRMSLVALARHVGGFGAAESRTVGPRALWKAPFVAFRRRAITATASVSVTYDPILHIRLSVQCIY